MSGIQGHLAELRSFSRCQMGRIPWIMGLVFLLAALGGYGVCVAYPQLAEALLAYFQQSISQSGVMDETGGLSFLALLLNDWSVMLFCILYGFLPFLFLPVLVAVTNAFIIGALAAIYHLNGISFLIFFSGILPHGIFEIPALLLAVTLGFLLCRNTVRILLHRERAVPMVDLLANILRVLLFLIFPLLLCAAAVEAYITPAVMSLFL